MVDEHYYNTPGWFINNQDFYDRDDRNKAKVYLGEYAAHLPGRPNNIETALAEALYPVSYTHLDVYKRQGICGCIDRHFSIIVGNVGCWKLPYQQTTGPVRL